jgi:hypothetical protein
MRRLLLVLGLAAALAACGNANVVTPVEAAQNYVFAVAEGNYPGACALLAPGTRVALTSARRWSCPTLFLRCLPTPSTALSHDQAQLLYANADLQVSGRHAAVTLSGTAVARAARRVTLVEQHGRWLLSSPGRAIARCVSRLKHHRRHPGAAARG